MRVLVLSLRAFVCACVCACFHASFIVCVSVLVDPVVSCHLQRSIEWFNSTSLLYANCDGMEMFDCTLACCQVVLWLVCASIWFVCPATTPASLAMRTFASKVRQELLDGSVGRHSFPCAARPTPQRGAPARSLYTFPLDACAQLCLPGSARNTQPFHVQVFARGDTPPQTAWATFQPNQTGSVTPSCPAAARPC
jgi:hypothetical protein